MKELFTVMIVVCGASLICSVFSSFISDGNTKKIVNLVLGAFIICSLIIPVSKAISAFEIDISQFSTAEEQTASCDEIMSNQVVAQTQSQLEQTATDILLQNGITINSCDITLAQTDNNRIIISTLCIYIDKSGLIDTNKICRIVEEHFGISPNIAME